MPFGSQLPELEVSPPGPASRSLAAQLAAVESANVTFVDDHWPVFWEEAAGANVRDADGNVYVDLTAAFGVALLGHAHPAVVKAIQDQAGRLIHGMGDVHPPTVKLELLQRLVASAPWSDARAVLGSTGSEAVEIALKTAQLATGRPGVLAFEGGYHGLTLGSLAATAREDFREPFAPRVYPGVAFAPFPESWRHGADAGERALASVVALLEAGAPTGDPIGAVIVEPVQGRGGARVAPPGFMAGLSAAAHDAGALVIADEVMTGMGRCGALFASELVGLRPDIVCLGKALGGGMPISACVGSLAVMDAWPASRGEALHTSTFLGHPLSCAAALAALHRCASDDVLSRVRALGASLLDSLSARLSAVSGVGHVRGSGLLIGIELVAADGVAPNAGAAARVARLALGEGVMVLPAGDTGHVVELTPAVALTEMQAEYAVEVLVNAIEEAI